MWQITVVGPLHAEPEAYVAALARDVKAPLELVKVFMLEPVSGDLVVNRQILERGFTGIWARRRPVLS